MLKASALIYSLFISLMLITLCSAIIMVSQYSAENASFWQEKEKVERNALSGIELLLASNEIVPPGTKKTIDLFGKGNDWVLLSKKNWGAFELICSEGFSSRHRFLQTALAGNDMGSDSAMALYLADMDKPLSLCGRTEIKGTCFLPKAGVKRAYIEGQNFVGNDLINGEVKPSDKQISPINADLIKNINKIFNKEFSEEDSIINADEKGIPSLTRSYNDRTICLYTSASLRLDTGKLQGNIILFSDKEITISAEANLGDIIVCAPKIRIEKKFSGSIQVFASDSVIVEEECHLNYPSVIGVIRQKTSCDNPSVIIKEDAEVSGIVFAYQEITDPRKQVKIQIDKDVSVAGYVYTNGLLDLKGSVLGSVMCAKFILSTPSSVYENHLLNAVIDRTKLSKYFVSSSLTSTSENKKIVKWLY